MQLEAAGFVPPVPPPGELDEPVRSSLILAYSLHYIKAWRHPQNRKYTTYCLSSEEDIATTTDNIYRKFGRVVFVTCDGTDRQTDRQTRWSQYFALHTDNYSVTWNNMSWCSKPSYSEECVEWAGYPFYLSLTADIHTYLCSLEVNIRCWDINI